MKLFHSALLALTLAMPAAATPTLGLADSSGADPFARDGGTVGLQVCSAASGKPLPVVKVEITPLGPTDPLWYGVTNREGVFMQDLPAGRYRARAYFNGRFVQQDFVLAQGETKRVRITLPGLVGA